ncbi:MAG: Mur ligase domain-containing protein [Bacteroidota bacterium]
MRIHFIGVGERIMRDLAASLSQQGHVITGSDVSFSQKTLHSLKSAELMPEQPGWFPEKMQAGWDKIIVGRQVQPDNPELKAAQQHRLPIYSYPEYIHEYAQDKQRIVITGGKDKSLICLLVLHTLSYVHRACDYVIGATNLDVSVQLSNAPIIILEGDMAPSSPINAQPQSLCYQHNIALISGIDWEHNSQYPTLETYLAQVAKLADASPKGGTLIYYEANNLVKDIGSQARVDVKAVPYQDHSHRYQGEETHIITPKEAIGLPKNVPVCAVAAAQQLLRNLAIQDQQFYDALTTFSWQTEPDTAERA